MKVKEIPERLDYCAYCKEEVFEEDNHVFYKGKYYHLDCFLTLHNLVLEIDDGEAD